VGQGVQHQFYVMGIEAGIFPLVPLIQPPIMSALTTQQEREIVMTQLPAVSQREKIFFPIVLLILMAMLVPSAAPLLGILLLGMMAFCIGTATGVLMAKLMNVLSSQKINPLIGAAGVSAVPMAARVANKAGLEANPHNFLLMHAMGPNVASVIGSAVAAGVLILCAP
jgi:oxaloacetate decarboxylase beta subunit